MTTQNTNRALALAAVVVSNFMIAIEATIVSTAMPQIVAQLGQLQLYSWVFASFLLTQTATTVVFGKLSDRVGRKLVMYWGLGVFLAGSLLCGLAWSLPSLIAFRLIQGVGAGAITPTSMTIVGDLYTPQERGRIQGYLASVWALSAVTGPLAGGLIIQHLSWAWIFWINLPLGVIATLLFQRFLHENATHKGGRVDHLGAGVFALAIAAIMADLTAMSTASGREIAALSLIALAAVALFVWRERRSPEPMISLKIWGRRPIAAANAASLLTGMVMIGLTTFVPIYVQSVMGRSALAAGFALSAMVMGWPVAATLSMRFVNRFGVRPVILAGGAAVPVGVAFYLMLDGHSSPWQAGVGSALVGFGMGMLSTPSIVLVQEIVAWSERGSATAAYLFARSLGSTFGATAFGAMLNLGLARSGFGSVSSDDLRALVENAAKDAGGGPLRAALESSLHLTFLTMFAVALAVALVNLLIPGVDLARKRAPAE
jgi:EmrB/QacA subfamily drug resistance transporter